MKIDFAKTILDLSGDPVRISETEALTLRQVATTALLTAHQEDERVGGDEKAKRFCLAMSLERDGGEVDLKVEDIALLKRLIGRMYAPLVVGRSYEILDG